MQETEETPIRSLSQEDSLEEKMAIHSSILAMERGAWQATVHGVANTTPHILM